MRAIKFDLSGQFAFFKKPDVNSSVYFSYGHIHKVALLGIIGACIGLKGYADRGNLDYPEFYSSLKDFKVSIVPRNKNAYINKFITSFNNSTGNASKEKGGNLIVTEQVLINPSWTIYIKLENDELSKLIEETFLNMNFKFIPYLGKNDFLADIENIELIELEKIDNIENIDSLFKSNYFEIKESKLKRGSNLKEQFSYFENLPIGLSLATNHYIMDKFTCTNKKVKPNQDDQEVLRDSKNNLNLYLF